MGVVPVPDKRLQRLEDLYHPKKTTPTFVEIVDIAGLVRGASSGEGLGNQFLGHIRSVDAIIQVVRVFDDPDIIHVHGKIDPVSDLEVIETELVLADLGSIETRLQKLEKTAKSGSKDLLSQKEALQEIKIIWKKDCPPDFWTLSLRNRNLGIHWDFSHRNQFYMLQMCRMTCRKLGQKSLIVS